MPHPSQATAATPSAKKPRGNPNLHLVSRCGARNRLGCPCRSPAIHGKLRCRMHGGRTPEGRDRARAAHTIHGNAGAEPRAKNRYRITLLHRTRVITGAADYQARLPPAFLARLHGYAPELLPPPQPTGGIATAADRMRRRAVAAALAPWKQAITIALAARLATRAAQPQAPVRARPPRDTGAAQPHAPIRRPANPPPPPAPTIRRRHRQWPRPLHHAQRHPRPSPDAARPGTAKPARNLRSTTPCTRPRTRPNKTCASQPHAPIPGRAEAAIPPNRTAAPMPTPKSAFLRISPPSREPAAAAVPTPKSAFLRINPPARDPAAAAIPTPKSAFLRINPPAGEPAAAAIPTPNPHFCVSTLRPASRPLQPCQPPNLHFCVSTLRPATRPRQPCQPPNPHFRVSTLWSATRPLQPCQPPNLHFYVSTLRPASRPRQPRQPPNLQFRVSTLRPAAPLRATPIVGAPDVP